MMPAPRLTRIAVSISSRLKLRQRAACRNAGVGDQHVDRSRLLREPLDVRALVQVSRDDAGVAQLSCQLVEGCLVSRRQGDSCTFRPEPASDVGPETR